MKESPVGEKPVLKFNPFLFLVFLPFCCQFLPLKISGERTKGKKMWVCKEESVHQFYQTLFNHWGVRLRKQTDKKKQEVILVEDDPVADIKMEMHDLEMAMKGIDVDDENDFHPCSQDGYMANSPAKDVLTPEKSEVKGEVKGKGEVKSKVVQIDDADDDDDTITPVAMDLTSVEKRIADLQNLN